MGPFGISNNIHLFCRSTQTFGRRWCLFLCWLPIALFAPPLMAQPVGPDITPNDITQDGQINPGDAALETERVLLLDVTVNGQKLGLIAEFILNPATNQLASLPKELRELGIKAPGGARGPVTLDQIAGLNYRFDPLAQTITISAGPAAMEQAVISAIRTRAAQSPDNAYGAVLNYSAVAGWTDTATTGQQTDLSMTLDGRVFSPFGVLQSSGIFASTDGASLQFRRLDTKYEYVNAARALRFTLGDMSSSSLSWSRPVRMGGAQLRRDFSVRPDIVTNALLRFEDVAALPSTVDIFINNNQVFSGNTPVGPYVIEDIPMVDGQGNAVVVIEDANGNVSQRSLPFFASDALLKPGTIDFSFEIGRAREGYGSSTDRYAHDTIYSGSLRYGLNDKFTLQSHVEGRRDLTFAGVGLSGVLSNAVDYTIAIGGSRFQGQSGQFIYGSARADFQGWKIQASMHRASDGTADLAYATGIDALAAGSAGAQFIEYPRAQDVITLSVPTRSQDTALGLSLVHADKGGRQNLIASVGYTHRLPRRQAVFNASAAYDFKQHNTNLSLGFSMPLGPGINSYSRLARGTHGASMSSGISRPISDRVGDYGYDIALAQEDKRPRITASGEYRSAWGSVFGLAQATRDQTVIKARVDGALAFTGGRFVLGNRVDDAFAIVETGASDVPVYLNNREVGQTGWRGTALITGLSSYFPNRVSVSAPETAQNLSFGATAMEVIPAYRAGVIVPLHAQNGATQITLILRRPDGQPAPLGSAIYLNGGKDAVVVGYDGVAVLTGIKHDNTVTLDMAGHRCDLSFAQPTPDDTGVLSILELTTC